MNFIFESLLKKLIIASKQRVIVPFYHKVSDEESTFEKYLYSSRKVLDFKKDIAVLSNYYSPISMQEFIEISKSTIKLNQNYFHLTFDDGLSNFYKVVAPILLEKKIPATVFINSDFVDNKALFYRYKASLLFQVYEKSSQKEKRKFHEFFNQKKEIKEKLFKVNYNNKEDLDRLANLINYNFEEYLEVEKPYLTTTQIQELIDMGFTIGAHSKSHPLYADISFQEQIDQTKECADWLEKRFNLDYCVFSFPFTDLNVSKEFFLKLARERVLDVSFGSAGIKNDAFKTNFHRLFFEIGDENAKSYLIKEYVKYFLKAPFNKNTMPRN
jgi:peptidoglycan/xylan/chitin deacetylase (PgdA/CDA1 family)